MPDRAEAITRAAHVLAQAVHEQNQLTLDAAVEAAYWRGGPTQTEIRKQILNNRKGSPHESPHTSGSRHVHRV